MSDTVLITALVTVAVGLTKVIEVLIAKMLNKNSSNEHAKESHKLDQIIDWQNVRDVNGVPMGYFPRTFVDTQEKIAESLRECVVLQGKLVEELDRVADKLDKFADKVDSKLEDIGHGFIKTQKTVNGRG